MDEFDIRREMEGRPAGGPQSKPKKTRSKQQRKSARVWNEDERKKLPPASSRASLVAQRWYDAAESHGFRLPYNVNWVAHQITPRVEGDKFFQDLLGHGRHDDAVRLLDKMTDVFWKEYVHEGDTAAGILNFYLDEAWDDVRYYAYDSLRAAYLKEHGRVRPKPEIGDHRDEELHKDLEALRLARYLEHEREVREAHPEVPERKPLTSHHRGVLKSALEKRRERKDQ